MIVAMCVSHCFSADQRLLEESTNIICKNFAINNCQTGNFGALVRVFLTRAGELNVSSQCDEWVSFNACVLAKQCFFLMISYANSLQATFIKQRSIC